MRRGVLLASIMTAGLLAPAGPAQAELRTWHVPDPPDARPTVSGVPNNPDIREVSVTYDSGGSVSLTVSFYNAVDALDTSEEFAFWGQFDLSAGSVRHHEPSICSGSVEPGYLSGQHHVYSSVPTTFYDRASMGGYGGYLQFSRTTSPDQRSVTISASSPALAGKDYRCLEYVLRSRSRSSVSNIHSEWSEACGCWYVEPQLDWIGGNLDYGYGFFQQSGGVWFDGFVPPLPAAAPAPLPAPGASSACVAAKKQKAAARKLVRKAEWQVEFNSNWRPRVAAIWRQKLRLRKQRLKRVEARLKQACHRV